MNITSALVLYALLWFMALFMLLPLFIRSQEEAGEVAPGTSAGAPENPMMLKKMLWATIASAVAWLIVFGVIMSGIITLADIQAVFGRPT
ncbi:DUF1467 family protein [Pikeienuella sp. HZG-20]|uniref:DUF1467 family protein n=1 Tax=Paludibacillus litoralis TaxID=3133267 RepID=UPI0030EB3D85